MTPRFRIHAICLVKNECDIIARTLTAAAEWADYVYVHDNGSTDGTWEQVKALAGRLPQIVPYAQKHEPFSDELRREAYNDYRDRSAPGDWWGLLGADEIYIDSPRQFLTRVPRQYDVVWSASFQYYLTEEDVARFAANPEAYADDVPVEEKCRYYVNNWSEIRFFRDRPGLTWRTGGAPSPLRQPYHERIRLRHYQYRSPAQIEKRFATRADAINRGIFSHETREHWNRTIAAPVDERGAGTTRVPQSWTERVVHSSELVRDNGRDYVITEQLLPEISGRNTLGVRVVRRLRRVLRTVRLR